MACSIRLMNEKFNNPMPPTFFCRPQNGYSQKNTNQSLTEKAGVFFIPFLCSRVSGGPGWTWTNNVSNVTVLRTASFTIWILTQIMVFREGFEPSISRLSFGGSNHLSCRNRLVGLAGVEPASSGLQPDALPVGLQSHMAGSAELESDAFCRHNPLSRRSLNLSGSLPR